MNNTSALQPRDCLVAAHANPLRIALVLSMAFVAGVALRQWAYDHTSPIRFELNQQNSFYWGDRIVHGTSPTLGPAAWKSFWQSYLSIYAADEANPSAEPHQLDYVPLRLLMAGAWVQYLNFAYGPVSQWRPEFARSFAAFSMVMELAAAVAMFALVGRWLKRTEPNDWHSPLPRSWGSWGQASAAAILMWLNPAAIVDSHVWPHGQTWVLPFYLFGILAMVEGRFFLAGAMIGLGSMFKGQMMLVAPVLILWPLFDRRWWGALRVVLGMAISIGTVAYPWIIRGSMAWARTGFAAHVGFTDVLRKGDSLNLPAVLEHWHMTLHQHLLDLHVFGLHLHTELRSALLGVYFVLLVCCAWGIARQARLKDRQFLASVAVPWALSFFLLAQMDERYLVWSACISAGAIVVNRRAFAAHLMLSFAGFGTMMEFLLICKPEVCPGVLHALILLNPVFWLSTAVALAILFVGSLVAVAVVNTSAQKGKEDSNDYRSRFEQSEFLSLGARNELYPGGRISWTDAGYSRRAR